MAGKDQVKQPPTFDTGGAGGAGSTETDDVYKIEVGFGLVDKNGRPLSLLPIQIGNYITTLAGTDSKAYARVAQAVKNISGRKKVDPSYVGGYVSNIAKNIMASSDIIARSGNLEDFFQKAIQAAGGGTQPSPPQSYISSPTQAKGDINKIFGDLLGRQATDKELKALTSILNDAQKKNPSKYVDGVTYGGLDKEQFLIDLITTGEYAANPKAFPGILGNIANEVAQKQTMLQEQGVLKTEDAIKSVAMLNDVNLSQDQLDIYRARVEAGEDLNLIKKEIRRLAAIGQPDSIKQMIEQGADLSTVYDPYRKIMGSVLEINPNSIPLNDPTLRMAIGPDKEMSLYEYQKSLRKDPRWEYTNQARTETANAITTVLRDFGFMG